MPFLEKPYYLNKSLLRGKERSSQWKKEIHARFHIPQPVLGILFSGKGHSYATRVNSFILRLSGASSDRVKQDVPIHPKVRSRNISENLSRVDLPHGYTWGELVSELSQDSTDKEYLLDILADMIRKGIRSEWTIKALQILDHHRWPGHGVDTLGFICPSPLDQFSIVPFYPLQIGKFYCSFTNAYSYFWLFIATNGIYSLFCSLPFVRDMTKEHKIIFYFICRFLFLFVLYKPLGYVLFNDNELQQAVEPSGSGGLAGGSAPLPGPTGPSLVIPTSSIGQDGDAGEPSSAQVSDSTSSGNWRDWIRTPDNSTGLPPTATGMNPPESIQSFNQEEIWVELENKGKFLPPLPRSSTS